MRGLVAIALVAGAAVAGAAPARPPSPEPLGFDHAAHARDVDKGRQPAVACARCHASRSGALIAPGHATCFATCHPPAPTRREAAGTRIMFCNPCHAEVALAAPASPKALAVRYPPYTLAPDHARRFGHERHAAFGCTQCHGKRDPRPHARCTGCHDGGTGAPRSFAMTACERCHPPGTGAPALARKPQQLVVTSAFSHARHATRGAAKQCATCHAEIARTDAQTLPRPTTATCAVAGCHDGAAAFGVTAACTRCHKDVPAEFTVIRKDDRFTHATHEKLQVGPCTSCHPFGKTDEVAVTGHAACASCHAKELGARDPEVWICSTCHNGSEPWRPLVADRDPPDGTEFGVSLDHAKHSRVCTSCHAFTTATSELRPPRGHRACTVAGCHAIKTGPAPRLDACEGCHARGLADQRDLDRRTAPWSVRATFVHAPHRRERSGKELACVSCHTDMRSPAVLALATPAKATCARCHDGEAAFKLTGTRCLRCHGARR